jgi:hypothetical protein
MRPKESITRGSASLKENIDCPAGESVNVTGL